MPLTLEMLREAKEKMLAAEKAAALPCGCLPAGHFIFTCEAHS